MNNIEFTPGKLYKLNDGLCEHYGFKTNIAMCLLKPTSKLWKIVYKESLEVSREYAPGIKMLVGYKIQEMFITHPMYNFLIEEL